MCFSAGIYSFCMLDLQETKCEEEKKTYTEHKVNHTVL